MLCLIFSTTPLILLVKSNGNTVCTDGIQNLMDKSWDHKRSRV